MDTRDETKTSGAEAAENSGIAEAPAAENAPQSPQTPFENLPPQPQYPQPPPIPAGANYIPPAGTYPPNGAPPHLQGPPPGTPVPPPQKTRKVGTITTAVCLILVGVLLALRVFLPNIDYLMIARLSPLILVLLGLEMLFAAARKKDEKLRYDLLSIFLCFLLIGGSMAAALVPEYFYRRHEANLIGTRISAELENSSATALQGTKAITYNSVDWYVDVQNSSNLKAINSAADLKTEDYIQVRVRMQNEFASKEEFAQACKTSADILMPLVPHLDYASFYSFSDRSHSGRYTTDIRYSLWLENTFQLNGSAEELAKQVYTEYWIAPEQQYVSEWEYKDRLANPDYYGHTTASYGIDSDEPEPADEDDFDFGEEGDEDEDYDDGASSQAA